MATPKTTTQLTVELVTAVDKLNDQLKHKGYHWGSDSKGSLLYVSGVVCEILYQINKSEPTIKVEIKKKPSNAKT